MDDFTLRTSDLLILIGACTNWCAGQKCGVGGVPTPAAGLPPPRAHPLRALLPPRASERAVVDVVQRAKDDDLARPQAAKRFLGPMPSALERREASSALI